MKTNNYLQITGLFIVSLITIATPSLFAQQSNVAKTDIEGKEYHGQKASEKISDASFVYEKTNSPYPAFVRFEKEQQKSFASFLPWLKQTFKTSSDVDFKLTQKKLMI
ncbi:MAG: hypothetical protein IPO27_12450 [Bacteroidetes bacterium]|nr:hypothetical protein [Bacteroidota bacterium]